MAESYYKYLCKNHKIDGEDFDKLRMYRLIKNSHYTDEIKERMIKSLKIEKQPLDDLAFAEGAVLHLYSVLEKENSKKDEFIWENFRRDVGSYVSKRKIYDRIFQEDYYKNPDYDPDDA